MAMIVTLRPTMNFSADGGEIAYASPSTTIELPPKPKATPLPCVGSLRCNIMYSTLFGGLPGWLKINSVDTLGKVTGTIDDNFFNGTWDQAKGKLTFRESNTTMQNDYTVFLHNICGLKPAVTTFPYCEILAGYAVPASTESTQLASQQSGWIAFPPPTIVNSE
jgi:hypothetical protein